MVENRQPNLLIFGLIIAGILILVGLTWLNNEYLVNSEWTGTNGFIARWMGSRMFVMETQSPYSEEISEAAQEIAYGRQVNLGEDPLFYLYPFYSFYLYFPFTFIGDIGIAQAAWMTFLELALLGLIFAAIRIVGWKIPTVYTVVLVLFAIIWFYCVYAIFGSNVVLLVTLLLVGFAYAVRSELDILAGILLAMTTIKPEVVLVAILFSLVWALSSRRWLIIGGFFGTLSLMVLSTVFLMPDWMAQNLRQLVLYYDVVPITNSINVLGSWLPGIGKQLGWGLAGLMLLILVVEGRNALGKGFRWFYWTFNLTLLLTILIGMPTSPINFVVLLPGAISVFITVVRWWGPVGRSVLIIGITALSVLFWGLFSRGGFDWLKITGDPVFFFVYPIGMLIGWYWIRWWAIQKQSLPLQEIEERMIEL